VQSKKQRREKRNRGRDKAPRDEQQKQRAADVQRDVHRMKDRRLEPDKPRFDAVAHVAQRIVFPKLALQRRLEQVDKSAAVARRQPPQRRALGQVGRVIPAQKRIADRSRVKRTGQQAHRERGDQGSSEKRW
jgi:hypothetical protein